MAYSVLERFRQVIDAYKHATYNPKKPQSMVIEIIKCYDKEL